MIDNQPERIEGSRLNGCCFLVALFQALFFCCLKQLKDLFTRVAALCVFSVSNVLCNKKKIPTCTLSVLRALLESLMLLSQTELISTTPPSSMLRRWSTSSSAPYPAGGFHFFVDLSLSYFFPGTVVVITLNETPSTLLPFCERHYFLFTFKVQDFPATHLP